MAHAEVSPVPVRALFAADPAFSHGRLFPEPPSRTRTASRRSIRSSMPG